VRSGVTFFTAKVAEIVLEGYFDKSGHTSSRLTPRQREIIQLLAEGQSSKEIAMALGLSVKTAETHRANIMKRLNCHSASEIVRYAIRNNIIEA
jgi:DNA-binding NarL/FixJ family response regulator